MEKAAGSMTKPGEAERERSAMTPQETSELARDAMASLAAPTLLAVIGEDGWMSPAEPPDTDRLVQLAWDDMSYGENSRGFYDSVAEMPASGKMFWWSWPVGGGMHRLPSDHIGAWREMTANAKLRDAGESGVE